VEAKYGKGWLDGWKKPNYMDKRYWKKLEEQKLMITDDIIRIKNSILDTVGDDCEKIILFGSYAYGTPREDSDYDFYVVLKDGTEHPVLVMQKIYEFMCDTKYKPVDVLANYKSQFERRSALPTIDKTIANRGVVLYER
jgi:predicted nucleotidyltransferase